MNTKLKIILIIITIIVSSIIVVFLFEQEPHVIVKDAYCYNNNFNFTLKNTRSKSINIKYQWTLNDPKANMPLFHGNDTILLDSNEKKRISIKIADDNTSWDNEYDCFLVMNIVLYKGDEKIYQYEEQKSEYDWDYSTLPPKKK